MNNIPYIINEIIVTLTTGITLLLAFLCLTNIQGVNKPGNKWLGIFMLCIFFCNTDFMLMRAGIELRNTMIIVVLNISAYIFAPSFYYTTSYFITPNRPWKLKDYSHLFSFASLYLLYSYYLLYEKSSEVEKGYGFLTALLSGNFGIVYGLQIFYYCILSWRKLKKHEQNIQLFSSSIENIDLRWLKYMMICVFVMALFFVIGNLSHFPSYFFVIINLSYFIGFFIISFFSIKQKEIYPFTTEQISEIINVTIKESVKKPDSKKRIEDQKLEELKSTLLHVMKNDKPFLDYELTLVKLASMMDISIHQLSYLINTGFNENFYQFINKYRIEEAKRLILDKRMGHLNFQGIGFEVGFNSKSVFFATFKKHTGQTPSEYKIANNM